MLKLYPRIVGVHDVLFLFFSSILIFCCCLQVNHFFFLKKKYIYITDFFLVFCILYVNKTLYFTYDDTNKQKN
ncbi:hypothetical protein BD770DRAFT_226076 [Pilaira anomala]|nr:hypothetical protein BD770DRAFT_226076 [Pilaira anomala]